MHKKPWISFSEQRERLQKRGLSIDDNEVAEKILSTHNYYYITGYLHSYKMPNGCYRAGVCLSDIYDAMKTDRRLRMILSYVIDGIERHLKVSIAYCIGKHYVDDDLVYLPASKDYKSTSCQTNVFLGFFRRAVHNNERLPFVSHYMKKHGGVFPIWVAVEILTLGNLENLFCILAKEVKRDIADTFGIEAEILKQWLGCLRVFRNTLAHSGRLHNFNFRVLPKQCSRWEAEQTHKVFDYIYMCKFMVADPDEWNRFVIQAVRGILNKRKVDLAAYGFGDNWESLLRW